jgi:hypothetical protein
MTYKRLYTVVLEYKGGTYIGQASADTPKAVLSDWASKTTNSHLKEWGVTHEELSKIASDNLVPIDGCLNVWCASGSTRGGLVLVNVIATDESPRGT